MRPGNLGLETAKANAMISVYYANVDLSIMHQATDPTSSSQGESMERQECMLRGTLGLKFSISTCVLSRRRTQVSCLHTLGLADKNIEGNRRERHRKTTCLPFCTTNKFCKPRFAEGMPRKAEKDFSGPSYIEPAAVRHFCAPAWQALLLGRLDARRGDPSVHDEWGALLVRRRGKGGAA